MLLESQQSTFKLNQLFDDYLCNVHLKIILNIVLIV